MNKDEAYFILDSDKTEAAKAAKILRDFMTCKAGEDFVVWTLIIPYWHTLKKHESLRSLGLKYENEDK